MESVGSQIIFVVLTVGIMVGTVSYSIESAKRPIQVPVHLCQQPVATIEP